MGMIRLPQELHEGLHQRAQKESRSDANMLAVLLADSLEGRQPHKLPRFEDDVPGWSGDQGLNDPVDEPKYEPFEGNA